MMSAQAQTPRSQSEQKRRVLSCLTCRRRKLRCDREYPGCGRCRRAGNPCYYDEQQRLSELGRSRSPSRSPRLSSSSRSWRSRREPGRLEREAEDESRRPASQTLSLQPWQQLRNVSMAAAETNVRAKASASTRQGRENQPGIIKAAPESASPPPLMETLSCRGKDFRTQYYGSTSPKGIIVHFPDLRVFIEAAVQDTSLPRVQGDLKALQVSWKAAKAKEYSITDGELLHLLPDRETVDHLVRLYFDTHETMFRILHGPSFWEEYQMSWENLPAANPAFVVLILLVMAVVSCISTKEPPSYIGDSAIARERAVLWMEVSERWLRRQSRKRTYLTIWQIRCLLYLAKQTNAVQKKQLWTVAGTLIREAMSAGFHRDLSRLGPRISPFTQEMRRRLWATMLEFELQASIDRGMPSTSASSDCATVLNINDDELAVDCETLPKSRPWDEYTECSYLHISRASFSLRASLNSLVNDPSSPLLYKDVASYEEMIIEEIEKLPQQADQRKTGNLRGMPAIVKTLLDIQLRQFLMLLHAPFARRTDSSLRSSPSLIVCFNTAASILEQHTNLISSGSLTLLLLRQDYLIGALIICHNMYLSITLQSNFFFNSVSNTCVQYIENAITLLGERITRLGTGHMQYWYVSVACALLRSIMLPQESALQKQRAVDRVLRQYYRVLTSQVDLHDAKKMIPVQLGQMMSAVDPLQVSYYKDAVPVGDFDVSLSQPFFELTDLSLEGVLFDDPAMWTMEDIPLME